MVANRNTVPTITTFHGADGCGKSSIAKAFGHLETNDGNPTQVIGGSSYEEWLTPEVARNTLGTNHMLGRAAITPEEKARLYEDIAIACYCYAGHLRDDGVSVAIDSDPVLKRLIWASLELDAAQYHDYADSFGERVINGVPDHSMPSTVIGVNVLSGISESLLLNRIAVRGGVSEFDPSSPEEMILLQASVDQLWNELKSASESTSPRRLFNERFGSVVCVELVNSDCEEDSLEANLVSVAQQARDSIAANVAT